MTHIDHDERMSRARRALDGLSVGDAFGEKFFATPSVVERMIEVCALPAPPWSITDDSVMAMSIVDVLSDAARIDRDRLADFFGARYRLDPGRGYGGTAHDILEAIASGARWDDVSPRVFDGGGSKGNGGAMRAAPVGAYFFDDYARAVDEARRSAEVTHAHPEGQAGAIAVAVAAAYVARGGESPDELFEVVIAHTPAGETRRGIAIARAMPFSSSVRTVVERVGNGSGVIAPDTVPFTLWCAARHLGHFEEALWQTVSGLGDRDTTCAIVGGIVSLHAAALIPEGWLRAREPLERMSRERLGERFVAQG